MIKIICVGKIKENFYKEAIAEYLKRLSKYTKIEIIEVQDFSLDNRDIILNKEADLILKNVHDKDYLIALDINGKEMCSVSLSKHINEVMMTNPNLCFIIGGSYGLADKVKNRCELMSFSKLTFPHQLFRVILLEQIYRSFKIINNESYHK